MAWRIFVNGADGGEAKNLRIIPGKQEFTRVPIGGGQTELIPGFKDSDRFQLESDRYIDTNADLELRDGAKVLRLMADTVRSSASGGSIVSGFVQPEPRE